MRTNEEEFQYLAHMGQCLSKGSYVQGRHGGVYKLFGAQLRFNLEESFPAVTTKKLYWKGVVEELLWFLRGDTDSKRLEQRGVKIWKGNTSREYLDRYGFENYPEGYAGNAYGKQMRMVETPADKTCVYVNRRYCGIASEYVATNEEKSLSCDVVDSDIDRNTYTNTIGEKYSVCGKIDNNDGASNSMYLVEFEDGTQVTAQRGNVKNGQVKNPFSNTVHRVACVGRADTAFKPELRKRAYDMWHSMVSRCYNPDHPSYKFYGERGVGVCHRWLCFANFLRDLSSIPFFTRWLNDRDYQLDKDYYSSNGYSPSTCIFLHWKENRDYATAIPVEIKEGPHKGKYTTIRDASSALNVNSRRLSEHINGVRYDASYPKVEKLGLDNEGVWRYRRVVDQISNVIEGLKENPHGRRHIVSMWNVGQLPQMALPPCHVLFQFYVDDVGRLSCQMYQRSVDMFLGAPFNIASYALLTHIIAQITGYSVGEFVWTLGDYHVCEDHVEAVTTQLERDTYPFPQLKMPEFNSIDEVTELTHKDFELIGYEHHPAIKAEMKTG